MDRAKMGCTEEPTTSVNKAYVFYKTTIMYKRQYVSHLPTPVADSTATTINTNDKTTMILYILNHVYTPNMSAICQQQLLTVTDSTASTRNTPSTTITKPRAIFFNIFCYITTLLRFVLSHPLTFLWASLLACIISVTCFQTSLTYLLPSSGLVVRTTVL